MGNFRKVAVSIATAVLFGLIIISFLFMGNGGNGFSNLKFGGGTDVITAGQRKMSAADYKRYFESVVQSLSQQNQRQVTDQEAIDNHVDEQALPAAAAQEAELDIIRQLGVKASPAMIAQQLQTQTAFFNPVSGKFDPKAYRTVLAQHDLDPKTYEQGLSDDLSLQAFNAGAAAGIKAPRAYTAFLSLLQKQSRTVSYVTLDQSQTPKPAAPTDAQLIDFMKENASNFTLPELRQLSIVRFSAKALAPTMPVDEAAIQKQFDFRKDAETKPETRSLIQVTTKDQGVANAASARITKGEDPQAVAKALGAQAIVYDDKPKAGVPDPKVATVAFSMTVGQVSGAIKGDLGYSVVKVTGISAGKEADLATMRPQLETAARQQAAEVKVTQDADKFETAHGTGADINKAADAVGAKVITTPAIVAQGVNPDDNKPADGISPKLLQIAFKQAAGSESDIESDGPGEYFVVRTDKIIPPALTALDKVRPQITKFWTDREIQRALKTKADAVSARLKKGESLDTVAGSMGLKVEHIDAISRDDASQPKNETVAKLGPDFMNAVFAAKKGDVLAAPGPQSQDPKVPANPAQLVGRVDNIATGDINATAQLAVNNAAQVNQAVVSELGQSIVNASRDTIKPKIYPDRAKTALGLDPATASKPKDKAG